jgi:hypothetical protein
MKIALVSHTSQLAGAEKILLNMASLLKNDYSVEVFLFAYGDGPMKEYAQNNNINYISLDNPLPWYLYVNDNSEQISLHWGEVQTSVSELVKLFKKIGIQSIVINTMTNLSGFLAASELNIPSILWIHGINSKLLVIGYY